MSLSTVKPNEQSGNAAISIAAKVRDRSNRSLRRGRPPKVPNDWAPTQSEYEKARIAEIENRAKFYRLKVERLQSELLDRKILVVMFTQIYQAIGVIIAASPLTQRGKDDCLRNLRPIDEVIAAVVREQNSEVRRSNDNGNSHHGEDELS